MEFLAEHALTRDVNVVIHHHILWATFDFGFRRWRSLHTIERLFKVGV